MRRFLLIGLLTFVVAGLTHAACSLAHAQTKSATDPERFIWVIDAGAKGYEDGKTPDGWKTMAAATRGGIGWVASPRLAAYLGSSQDWSNSSYDVTLGGGYYPVSKIESDVFRVAVWFEAAYLFGSGNDRLVLKTDEPDRRIAWRVPIVAGYNFASKVWAKLIPVYDITNKEFTGFVTVGLSDDFGRGE